MCLFCRMLAGEVPMDVVRETGQSVAFRDINPQAPTHVLVIPRRHVENLGALAEYPEELADLVALGASVAEGGLATIKRASVLKKVPSSQRGWVRPSTARRTLGRSGVEKPFRA